MMCFSKHAHNFIFRKKENSAPFWQDKGTPVRTDAASPEASYPPSTTAGLSFWLKIHYHLRTHSVRIRLGKTPELAV
jgi:hypothetical protein